MDIDIAAQRIICNLQFSLLAVIETHESNEMKENITLEIISHKTCGNLRRKYIRIFSLSVFSNLTEEQQDILKYENIECEI